MKTLEKIVIFLTLLLGIGMLFLSLVSMYNDLSANRPIMYYVVDMGFFTLSLLIIGGALRLYKRVLAYEALADAIVDDVLYNRLKPLLEQIAFSTAEIDEVRTKLSEIESELRGLEERMVRGAPETVGVTFYVKTIAVAMIYFGIFLFMINFVLPYEVFMYVVFYVIWWGFITQEFKLYDRMDAWIILSIPLLIVPTASIIIESVFGIVTARAVVFWTSLIYAYVYYRYARRQGIKVSGQMSKGTWLRRLRGKIHDIFNLEKFLN